MTNLEMDFIVQSLSCARLCDTLECRVPRSSILHRLLEFDQIHAHPVDKEMATYFSILAWRIPWTEEPDRLQSMGLQKSDMT